MKKYMKNDNPYELNKFSSDRFDMIKQDIKDYLEGLITKPPT